MISSIVPRMGASIGLAIGLVAAVSGCSPAPTEFSLDFDRLSAGADTFAFLHDGEKIGEMVVSLQRDGATWTLRERTDMPAGFQETTVVFTEHEMRAVEQFGRMGPVETAIDVAYGGGRVDGRAVVPGAAGVDSVEVDAEVPDDVIDDNLLVALFPAMTLAPGMSFTLPVFAAGRNQLMQYEFAVGPGARLSGQEGEVETLRLDVTGAGAPLSFLVTADRPHRLMQILPAGPLKVVRVGPA